MQEFDTRWDEVLLYMSKIPSDDVLECLFTLRIRESDQLKTVLQMFEMETHQKIPMPSYQKIEDDGEEKYKSETPIAKLLTPDTGKSKQEQWSQESKVLKWR